MSEQQVYEASSQGLECVTTNYLVPLACSVCSREFLPERKNQVNCSSKCNTTKKLRERDIKRKVEAQLRQLARNIAWSHLNRDRYLSFDGKYEGSLNKPITVVFSLKRDKSYRPMPIDVHVKPVEPKFVDGKRVQDEGKSQLWKRSFPHSLGMPRSYTNFCPECAHIVIDSQERTVRVTKGCYRPLQHSHNTSVYDLRGNLITELECGS